MDTVGILPATFAPCDVAYLSHRRVIINLMLLLMLGEEISQDLSEISRQFT